MRCVSILLFLWCFKNTVFNLLSGPYLKSFCFLSDLCQMLFKKRLFGRCMKQHIKKALKVSAQCLTAVWATDQMGNCKHFVAYFALCCCYHLCLSMSEERLGSVCQYLLFLQRSFNSMAESSPIMGFREKYVTEIGCWHFICIEFIGIKFTKILGMPINLLWAIAFLVINPFCHSLHSVPAKLPAFQCAKTMCQKSAEAVVYNWEKKWPIKFRRALETNLCKSEYITISERQQALQYFYCYLTSQ